MSSPARSGWRRLTRLGSSTLSRAMAAPASTVPGNSSAPGAAPRRARPMASRTRAAPSTRSSPNRRASGDPAPETTPKHSTGMAASTACPAGDSPRAPCSSGNSGGRLVMAARMLAARARIPASSSPPDPQRAMLRTVPAGFVVNAGDLPFCARIWTESRSRRQPTWQDGAMTGEVSPVSPGVPEHTAGGELRASHTDRDAVVEQLRVAAGDGRLTSEELDERLERALTARTYRELAELTTDLPAAGAAGRSAGPGGPEPRSWPGSRSPAATRPGTAAGSCRSGSSAASPAGASGWTSPRPC